MRMIEATGNAFGIDPNKIVLGGQGTGGYIALGYATLDDENELYLPKFLDWTDPANPIPYIFPGIFGNIDGTDLTYFPANTPPFNAPAPFVFNQPNNPSYSNDINMAFNLGGALADISWLEAGDVPIVSFHCANDPYAPIDTGNVIVPTTGDFVVEVMGSRTVQHYSNLYGNNDVFVNAGFTDDYTTAANTNNSGYEGLYVFQTPPPSSTANAFGQAYEEEGSPWDWWDNVTYGIQAEAVNGVPGMTSPAFFEANALLGNPNMSAAKGRTYIDTVQGYLNPRIYVALNLGGVLSVNNVVDYSTNIFPNPAKNNITIENSNFVINSVKLYNIAGQLVKSENVNSMKANLNISDLNKGIYILEIKSKETSIRRKLIVE